MLMRLMIPAMLMLSLADASHAGVELRQIADASGEEGLDAAQSAAREMAVGRYYVSKRDYTAAISRFRTVVTAYRSSPDVEEALGRLVECYLSISIDYSEARRNFINSEAQTAVAVLVRKFHEGRWSSAARDLLRGQGLEPIENQESWISRSFK